MEARKYFKQPKAEFACNMFGRKMAIGFIKKLYKLGVINVDIYYDYKDDGKDNNEIFADTMIITLPKQLSKRIDILSFITQYKPDEMSIPGRSSHKLDWKKATEVLLWWD